MYDGTKQTSRDPRNTAGVIDRMSRTFAASACLLIVMLCGNMSSGSRSHTPSSGVSNAGRAQPATEPLVPGEPKAGSIAASLNPGTCMLSDTQYTVQYPGGGSKLSLEFHADYPVNLAVRRNLPVANESGKIVADSGPSIVAGFNLPSNPPLDAATYYIAVVNCATRAINFTLTAVLIGPPDADRMDLGFPSLDIFERLELGSIPMTDAANCSLSRTQYTVSVSDSAFCDTPSGWFITLRGDQNLNLYARLGQRVAVEDGKVVADFASKTPEGNGFFSVGSATAATPGVRTYFIAVESCNPNAANYALTFKPYIGDLPASSINSVFLENKNLIVMGYFLGPSSTVLIDGNPQRTKYAGSVPGRFFTEDVLIVKKARRNIDQGQGVTVNVKTDSGCTTRPFGFVRPTN